LKPGLLMAHLDVVPVDPETVSLWKYPPFSGFYDSTTDKSRALSFVTCHVSLYTRVT